MPKIADEKAEVEGVLSAARAMAVAARTAPKARGVDAIETLIVYGDDLKELAEATKKQGSKFSSSLEASFGRDAENIRASNAVLLIGLRDLRPKKLENPLDCGACGHGDCKGFLKIKKVEGKSFPGPVCLFQAVDLGIALSAACSVAARFHVDNRMMYTAGSAACNLGWMESQIIIAIPLSCSGKSIYFDREPAT
jgi:uncharacterized ferredoxin-like protein